MTNVDKTPLEQKLKKLFQDGKLVQVHVSKWGMSYQLSEDDLELQENKHLPAFMRLGKKMLFDNEVRNSFGRIEGAARRYLKDSSFKFPIADAHFVTRKNIVTVMEALETFKKEYDETTRRFLENYEQHKTEMLTKFQTHRELLEPYYPHVTTVKQRFGFNVSVFEVAFPKKIKELSIADIHAQNESVEEKKKKYESQMEAQYQKALHEMDSFVKEAVVALRGQVVEVFDTIAKKIKDGDVISAKNIKSIRKMVDDFDALDFFDDTVVKKKLAIVKALVQDDTANFKDNQGAIQALQLALDAVLTTTKDITDVDVLTGSYFRKIDINDDL